MADKPVDTVRVGAVQLSIWENKTAKGTFKSVTVDKSYKDGENWKRCKTFKMQDLPLLVLGLNECLRRNYLKTVIKPEVETKTEDF